MEIHLKFGGREHECCTLCMATDDLYVLGFRNGTGQFYGFKGKVKGTYVLYLVLIIYLYLSIASANTHCMYVHIIYNYI